MSYGYGPRGQVGFSPYLAPRGRGRVGVPLLPAGGVHPAIAQALQVLGSFATAQGGNPAIMQAGGASMRGTREGIGFPNTVLAGVVGTAGTTQSTSQGIFRPSKMIVANSQDSAGLSVSITQILVGSETAMVDQNPLIGAVFLATAVECGITYPTADSGITISVTGANNTASTTTMFVTMLGEYVRGGGRDIGG